MFAIVNDKMIGIVITISSNRDYPGEAMLTILDGKMEVEIVTLVFTTKDWDRVNLMTQSSLSKHVGKTIQ